jgi:hypothetical protein
MLVEEPRRESTGIKEFFPVCSLFNFRGAFSFHENLGGFSWNENKKRKLSAKIRFREPKWPVKNENEKRKHKN